MFQLTELMEKITAATAAMAKLQDQLPALIAAVALEAKAVEVKPVETVALEAKAVETKPKKPASDGTMAWHAFVKHCQNNQPSRFADLKKRSDVLHEVKAIREEDEDSYKNFIASWKTERLSAAPVAEAPVVSAFVEEVVVVKEKEKKKVAVGTMAWHAFVAHCKATMPELNNSTNAEKLQAIKARKENDSAAYETFVTEWKTAQPV
jgi:hypothetical protein